ncbi:MAG: GNAT family N-acetyltransferase [Chloroflexi bacterium]|nr:GNAT family N-acetyltransferase [Chloroflexota bacterium]
MAQEPSNVGDTPGLDTLVFHPVDEDRWPDMRVLAEASPELSRCWCMEWRPMPDADRDNLPAREVALGGLVKRGVPIGILGYVDGDPIAWCSIAPKPTYYSLWESNADGASVVSAWAIVCFFIHEKMRGKGLTKHLIAAAVDYAREHGATLVEAYPVDPDSPRDGFMGFLSSFEHVGFREVAAPEKGRHIVQLTL